MSELKKTRNYIWVPWLTVSSPFLAVFFGLLLANYGFFGPLPTFEELENPKSSLATEIITADNKILGRYFLENRTRANYKEISPHVFRALIATEDERYMNHSGIDARGVVRAVLRLGKGGGGSTITQQLAKLLFSEVPTSKLERIKQKLKEWIIAARLERQYTKEEILTMYLNRFDFLNNAVGIKSAARIYFNKLPVDLSLDESAMLVGMAKNPSIFNPVNPDRFDTTRTRRNVVFAQMLRNNMINQLEFDSLKALPLALNYQRVDHKLGTAPYFREVLRAELKRLFEEKDPTTGEFVIHKPDGKPYNIYRDGLKVYTTIDLKYQEKAEWAVKEHLSVELQPDFFRDLSKRKNIAPYDWKTKPKHREARLNAAKKQSQRYAIYTGKECTNCGRRGKYLSISIQKGTKKVECLAEDCKNVRHLLPLDSVNKIFDSKTNMKIFTWNGEVDTLMSPMDSIKYYKSILQAGLMSMDPSTGHIKAWVGGINYQHFRYDHVRMSKRQVGSTIKPILYTIAMQRNYTPCDEIPNKPVTIHKGQYDLMKDWTPKTDGFNFHGMVTLKFGLANSMNNVTAWIMKQFGPQVVVDLAKEMGISSPLKPVPSLCLGVEDISLFEMTGAFSTYANKGVWTEPIFITRIEDNNGNLIKNFIPNTNEAMTEEIAYIMLEMLKGTVDAVYNKYWDGGKARGTAMRLRLPVQTRPYGGFRNPIAGKTGTTQNHSDGWFIGLTPELVTGVWVGANEPGIRFSVLSKGMGTNMALPIWGYYMQKVYADSTIGLRMDDFEKPEKRISIETECGAIQDPEIYQFDEDEEFNNI